MAAYELRIWALKIQNFVELKLLYAQFAMAAYGPLHTHEDLNCSYAVYIMYKQFARKAT